MRSGEGMTGGCPCGRRTRRSGSGRARASLSPDHGREIPAWNLRARGGVVAYGMKLLAGIAAAGAVVGLAAITLARSRRVDSSR